MKGYEVGRVIALWRYPVKSMSAEALRTADLSWHGLAGDRRWAFVRPGPVRNGFPWLTLRQRPGLNRYRPAFVDPCRPDRSRTVVHTPSGDVLDVTDPALAAELGAHAMKLDRGTFDTLPLSLITTRTLAGLAALAGRDLDVRRFRPNLLVEPAGDDPYPEDRWVGQVLRVGGARIRVDGRDKRCVVVNVDPVTGRRDPTVLRTIARERQVCLGVYGSTVQPGPVAVGDAVLVEA